MSDETGTSTGDGNVTNFKEDGRMTDDENVTKRQQPVPAWPEEGPNAAPVRNGMAIAALVLGIISIPGIYLLGVLDIAAIILAIVFGVLALRRVKRGTCTRKGFAIAGIATGGVGAILLIVAIVVSQRAISDCKHKIGPNATDKQIQTCLNNKRHGKS